MTPNKHWCIWLEETPHYPEGTWCNEQKFYTTLKAATDALKIFKEYNPSLCYKLVAFLEMPDDAT